MYRLAWAYHHLGHPDKTRALLDQVVALDHAILSPIAIRDRGPLPCDAARAELKHRLDNGLPSAPAGHYALVQCLVESGDRAGAKAEVRQMADRYAKGSPWAKGRSKHEIRDAGAFVDSATERAR